MIFRQMENTYKLNGSPYTISVKFFVIGSNFVPENCIDVGTNRTYLLTIIISKFTL